LFVRQLEGREPEVQQNRPQVGESVTRRETLHFLKAALLEDRPVSEWGQSLGPTADRLRVQIETQQAAGRPGGSQQRLSMAAAAQRPVKAVKARLRRQACDSLV
jgi:hypothetical protein